MLRQLIHLPLGADEATGELANPKRNIAANGSGMRNSHMMPQPISSTPHTYVQTKVSMSIMVNKTLLLRGYNILGLCISTAISKTGTNGVA